MSITAGQIASASDFVATSAGAGDAGKGVKLNGSGKIDSTMLSTKFGGTGADGALTISSGTTTLDAANARVLIKNYTSISITGTGKLAFSNPHANGTYIFLRATGNVTLTSSQTPMIDISNMGAAGGAGFFFSSPSGTNVGQGANAGTGLTSPFKTIAAASGGSAGTVTTGLVLADWIAYQLLYRYGPWLSPGGGGSSGSAFKVSGNYSTTTGTGGRGAGALLIECGGTFTFTTANGLSTKGQDGTNSTGATGGSQTGSGGGGGGGGGSVWIFYNTAGTLTGTIDQSASAAGTGQLTSGTTGSASGGGGGASYTGNGTGGTSTSTTGNGGPGAASTNSGWILNTEFA